MRFQEHLISKSYLNLFIQDNVSTPEVGETKEEKVDENQIL